jgi:hypothetical protein
VPGDLPKQRNAAGRIPAVLSRRGPRAAAARACREPRNIYLRRKTKRCTITVEMAATSPEGRTCTVAISCREGTAVDAPEVYRRPLRSEFCVSGASKSNDQLSHEVLRGGKCPFLQRTHKVFQKFTNVCDPGHRQPVVCLPEPPQGHAPRWPLDEPSPALRSLQCTQRCRGLDGPERPS